VPLPAARLTPNLEENQGFRAFQLSPQEAPRVWSDASEPSSGRWNYGWEMAEKFCEKWRLPRHFWVLLHAVKHDMWQTALIPLRREACWGFFRTLLVMYVFIWVFIQLTYPNLGFVANKSVHNVLRTKVETYITRLVSFQSDSVYYSKTCRHSRSLLPWKYVRKHSVWAG
jgi:hypothetical protein